MYVRTLYFSKAGDDGIQHIVLRVGLNRLGLREEPAPQPQHTQFSSPKKGSHCRIRTYIQPLTRRNALPLCQGGGLRDLRFKSYRVCCGDRNKSITYKRQDRNKLGLNRLGLREEPAPQPQHTQFSSPKKGSHCRIRTYVQPLTGRNALLAT